MKDLVILFLVFLGFAFKLPGTGENKNISSSATPVKMPGNNMAESIGMDDTDQYDGPYVSYKSNRVFIKYILKSNGSMTVKDDSLALAMKDSLTLKVKTDVSGEFFFVKLKGKLEDEKNVFKIAGKQLVLSDIEGNFGAFRKLLQSNGVINNELNWTFGDGHLVLIGDFFDRGEQVTEVLWLIYSLEEKAKAAGGYVHFILGNHEIMNLTGDLRYVSTKYTTNALLLGEAYESLYAANTELGRWLRTKNIIEKVGDVLFMHGGISAEVNRFEMTVKEINRLARPYYADTTYNYPDQKLDIIFGNNGPFWYRNYYYSSNKKAMEQQIDSTLWQFSVRHIATGHCIVADTVSAWYNGKLFNTDTHHADGKSEALLIEGNRYYRVNAVGNKVLLTDR